MLSARLKYQHAKINGDVMSITNAAICHEFYINGLDTKQIAEMFNVDEALIANKKARIPKETIDEYKLAKLRDRQKRGAA